MLERVRDIITRIRAVAATRTRFERSGLSMAAFAAALAGVGYFMSPPLGPDGADTIAALAFAETADPARAALAAPTESPTTAIGPTLWPAQRTGIVLTSPMSGEGAAQARNPHAAHEAELRATEMPETVLADR